MVRVRVRVGVRVRVRVMVRVEPVLHSAAALCNPDAFDPRRPFWKSLEPHKISEDVVCEVWGTIFTGEHPGASRSENHWFYEGFGHPGGPGRGLA